MKIRRYLASNTQEALVKVKMDLGNDAVILNTRKVRQKGLFKIFAKPMIEVLAAIDEDAAQKNNQTRDNIIKRDKFFQESDIKTRPVLQESMKNADIVDRSEKISQLESKVNNLEVLLNKIYDGISGKEKKEDQSASETVKSSKKQLLQQVLNNLAKNDIDPEIAKMIITQVDERLEPNAGINEITSQVRQAIAGILGKPETVKLKKDGKPTVILFLGPTGVGKTTTLAKLAASYALNQKIDVGLITADTYRIAAVDQLKTYAEIIGIPVSVIYSVDEIKGEIEKYKEKDLILVDTAGTSYNNKTQFDEIKALTTETEADEIYLVLSSTISSRNCKEILANYQFLKDYKLIFTKLDETNVNGLILNTRYSTGKSLSYITTGQSVPDDIEVADVEKITKKLLGA